MTSVTAAESTTAADYKANRMPVDQELMFARSHGYPLGHGFYRSSKSVFDYVYASEYRSAPPPSLFYSLYICSGCDYTTSNYLGGTIIFNTGTGLLAWGSSKTGGMWADSAFYTPMASGKPFGEAFRAWFNTAQGWYPSYAPSWWYGMVLVGDGSLRPSPLEPPLACQPDGMVRVHGEPEADYKLDDTYNSDAAGQTASRSVPATVPAVYDVQIQNDGVSSDTLTVTGSGGGGGWTVTYFDALSGGTDITASVTGTGWALPATSGSYAEIRAEVTPDASIADGGVKPVTVTATSAGNGSKLDAVKAQTTKVQGPVRIVETDVHYPTIQAGINAATTGQTVEASAGTYVENIDFIGKAITVRSTDPEDPEVVAATIVDGGGAGSVVSFANSEGSGSVLTGLTIRNGDAPAGGGVHCDSASPTISRNVITGNTSDDGGGIYCAYFSNPTISNCTLSGNEAMSVLGGGVFCDGGSSPTIRNTIIAFSVQGAGIETGTSGTNNPAVTFSDVYGNDGGEYVNMADPTGSNGNISVDPLFVSSSDLHLQSEGGHWNGTDWTVDADTSPCVDTGDPDSPVGDEPAPNGGCINMGAYGGTAQASKSGAPAVTVTGIAPNTGENDETALAVTITGTGFLADATVTLSKAGFTNISADGVVVVSDTTITCKLNLSRQPAGLRDVVVRNTDGGVGVLVDGFTVQADLSEPQALSWESLKTHANGVGVIALPVLDGFVESRYQGLGALRVTCNEPLDPATVVPGAVTVTAVYAGNCSGQVSATRLDETKTILTITFSPLLTSQDTYLIELSPTITDPAGNALEGQLHHKLSVLEGSVNGDRRVDIGDLTWLRSASIWGQPVTAATAPADLNGDGRINIGDLTRLRSASIWGKTASAPLPEWP